MKPNLVSAYLHVVTISTRSDIFSIQCTWFSKNPALWRHPPSLSTYIPRLRTAPSMHLKARTARMLTGLKNIDEGISCFDLKLEIWCPVRHIAGSDNENTNPYIVQVFVFQIYAAPFISCLISLWGSHLNVGSMYTPIIISDRRLTRQKWWCSMMITQPSWEGGCPDGYLVGVFTCEIQDFEKHPKNVFTNCRVLCTGQWTRQRPVVGSPGKQKRISPFMGLNSKMTFLSREGLDAEGQQATP